MEKPTGIKLPTAFPKTLEIERTDSHIPSAPATTAKLTQNQNPKGPSPVRPTFAPFRLILQLEKTIPGPVNCARSDLAPVPRSNWTGIWRFRGGWTEPRVTTTSITYWTSVTLPFPLLGNGVGFSRISISCYPVRTGSGRDRHHKFECQPPLLDTCWGAASLPRDARQRGDPSLRAAWERPTRFPPKTLPIHRPPAHARTRAIAGRRRPGSPA